MQTDPIGYKDDMDLYSYVGEDPVNHADPTGTTCTQNDKGVASCKVDENKGNLSSRDLKQVNSAYTKAVNNLLKHPDRSVNVSVGGKTFSTTAGARANSLMSAKVFTAKGSSTERAHTSGGVFSSQETQKRGGEITIQASALSSSAREYNADDDELSRTFIHESIHLEKDEVNTREVHDANVDKWQHSHRDPYNKAAWDLF